MTNQTVEVDYHLTAEELTRCLSFVQSKLLGVELLRPWHWFYRILYFAVPTCFLVPLVLVKLSRRPDDFQFVLLCVSVGGLWFLFGEITVYLVYRLVVRGHLRKLTGQFQTPPFRVALAPRTVAVGPDGVHVRTEYHATHYRWSAFWRVFVGRNYLSLSTGGGAEVIPSRAFPDRARFKEFVALVQCYHAADGSAPFTPPDHPPPESYHATDPCADNSTPRR